MRSRQPAPGSRRRPRAAGLGDCKGSSSTLAPAGYPSRAGRRLLEAWCMSYWPEPLKKAAAKRIANDFVASRRSSEFADGLKSMSTLYNMSKWVQKGRVGLPEYLLRTCTSSLHVREGRRLKTKLRLGCHDPRSSSCRMQRVRKALVANPASRRRFNTCCLKL